jgi:uncharacterized protein YjiS (DUF1127 family)
MSVERERSALRPQAPRFFRAAVDARVWRWITTVGVWLERRRSRRTLATLNDHMLRDIGITPVAQVRESEKPFWKE